MICTFLMITDFWVPLHIPVGHLYIIFGKMPLQVHCSQKRFSIISLGSSQKKKKEKKMDFWTFHPILSLPGERLATRVFCLLTLCWTRKGSYGNHQPKFPSLFLLAPDREFMLGLVSIPNQASPEAVAQAASGKCVASDNQTNFFPPWGEAGSWGLFLLTLCWAVEKGYDISLNPNCQLCSPPGSKTVL